ncbi:MAG: glycolate oxidase subunit GlcD, partial [Verrucomicrobia bacterium]|nr:glycolate oxidase subunit GlcD [Verrucomicrobiota bacterium]
IAAHIIPCTLEFLDKTTIACVESYSHIGLPLDCEAVLLMETDGHASVVNEEADRMCEIANSNGCRNVRIAANAAEAKQLAEGRRVSLSALAKVSPTTILEDVTVPRSKLVNMVKAVQETAQKHNLKVGIFGHFGDGNLHPTFLIDEKNEDEMKRVELAFDDIFKVALQLGGSVTGEHGVGLAKKKVLPQALGEQSIQVMRFMKKALDPNGILNPSKMFDL